MQSHMDIYRLGQCTCDNAQIGGLRASANELHNILVPHFPAKAHMIIIT